ncbi:MAG: MBL fold metallo-hydrolase [Actinomycetota bacterium]|nr:MBL fold metallo-hydrolase [Actinomycetota bacterium]MDH5223715.1 MBL fold metallo-hydrolase [Actinomycetota bacterium]MDH5312726.1 MBL fold metallo-hydrolase [Actinomycetota bacterium]
MSEIRVFPFLVSELHLPEAERALLGVEWWPSYGHAVEHPGGLFLFDNGAGFGNAEIDTTFSPRVRPVEDALEEAGISLGDVTGAANCHLHFDHCGQNARLHGLPIFVQRSEWVMVHEPDYTVAEWVDVPGLTYELLDGETEVAPGLRLIPTPGHTAGHQSLVIDAPGGAIVLAGQAVQSRGEWEGAEGQGASGRSGATDPDVYAHSVDRLRSLDPARVHFAHDPSIWER